MPEKEFITGSGRGNIKDENDVTIFDFNCFVGSMRYLSDKQELQSISDRSDSLVLHEEFLGTIFTYEFQLDDLTTTTDFRILHNYRGQHVRFYPFNTNTTDYQTCILRLRQVKFPTDIYEEGDTYILELESVNAILEAPIGIGYAVDIDI